MLFPLDPGERNRRTRASMSAARENAELLYMKLVSRNDILVIVPSSETPTWSFLTNHARVLLCIAQDPGVRLREIGDRVGITERAAHRIIDELVDAGYVSRTRTGRRNRYAIHQALPLPDTLVHEQAWATCLRSSPGLAASSTPGRAARRDRVHPAQFARIGAPSLRVHGV
ncbi:MAG TPA: winged helix-turn-helix domain-containing protein [Solirubrobacteraceae bacterium]|nr:winged helix-turn-helix domain-containing protein [Solirubrobacteraceae bacterium]